MPSSRGEPMRAAGAAVAALAVTMFVIATVHMYTDALVRSAAPVQYAGAGVSAGGVGAGARQLQQLNQYFGEMEWQTTLIDQVTVSMQAYREAILRVTLTVPNNFDFSNIQIIVMTQRTYVPSVEYGIMLGFQFAMCLVAGLILSTVGCFFWCCRCCKCCCCCCKQGIPRPEGYTLASRMCVWFWILIFTLTMAVGAFLALSANDKITYAIVTIYDVPYQLVGDVQVKLSNLSTGIDKFGVQVVGEIRSINGMFSGLNDIPGIVNRSVVAIKNITAQFLIISHVVSNMNANISSVKRILTDMADTGIPGVPSPSSIPSIPSSVQSSIDSAVSQSTTAQSQVATLAEDVAEQIAQINSTIGSALDSAVNTALSVLNSTKNMLTSPSQMLDGVIQTLNGFTSMVDLVVVIRQWAMFGIVMATLSLCVWPVIFGLFQCCNCFPRFCACTMSFWGFTFFFWLLFFMGFHLMFGLGLGDMCANWTNSIVVTIAAAGISLQPVQLGPNITLDIMQTAFGVLECPPGTNIFDLAGFGSYFNLSQQFDMSAFTGNLDLGGGVNISQYQELLDQFKALATVDFANYTSQFNVSSTLDQIHAAQANLTLASLGAPSVEQADDSLEFLNELTGITVTFQNVSNVDYEDYPADKQAAIAGNKTVVTVFLTANETINNLQGNLTDIDVLVSSIPDSLNDIEDAFIQINVTVQEIQGVVDEAAQMQIDVQRNLTVAAGITNRLQVNLTDIKDNAGNCTNISIQYFRLVSALCDSFGGGADVMWLGFLIIIVSLFWNVILGVLACQRWGQPYDPEKAHRTAAMDALQQPLRQGGGGGRRGQRRSARNPAPSSGVPLEPVPSVPHSQQPGPYGASAPMSQASYVQQGAYAGNPVYNNMAPPVYQAPPQQVYQQPYRPPQQQYYH